MCFIVVVTVREEAMGGKKRMGRQKQGELATATAIKKKEKVDRRVVQKGHAGIFWAAKTEKKRGGVWYFFFGW